MHNGDQRKYLSRLACPALQALEQEAVNWAKAQQLRGYQAALKEMLIAKHGEIQPQSTGFRGPINMPIELIH